MHRRRTACLRRRTARTSRAKKFEGSLPAFIAAFTKHQKISEDEIDEVQRMIDQYRSEAKHE
jgi:predicted transcriptional regulator